MCINSNHALNVKSFINVKTVPFLQELIHKLWYVLFNISYIVYCLQNCKTCNLFSLLMMFDLSSLDYASRYTIYLLHRCYVFFVKFAKS